MLKEKESVIGKSMILFDAIVVSLAFLLAFFLRKHFHAFYKLDLIPSTQVVANISATISEYLIVLFFAVPLWCFMLYLNGMYRSVRTKKIRETAWIIIKSSFFTTFAFGSVGFLFKLIFVSRMFFAIFIVVSSTFLFFEKVALFSIMHFRRNKEYNFRRLLICGTGRRAAQFVKKVQSHPEWCLKILGAIDDEPGRGVKQVNDVEIIGNLEDISKILHENAIDEVVFVLPRSRLSYIEEAVYACEIEGIKATVAVDLFDLKIARSKPTELDGIPLITFETTVAKEWQLFIKRGIDMVMSGLGIIILSPLFFIVAVLIRLTSSGPVLFKQIRVGLNGRKFVFVKFRTMCKEAEKELSKVDVFNEMDDPNFKRKKIQYITTIGRILRKFSFDEFPQLFNVFVGHMSLIGPRPTVPEELEQYKSWQRRRLSMRPGVTCLWQVSGRNKLDFSEWMKLDIKYLDNWSLRSDFKILIKTIPVVLFGIGAY